MYIMPIIPLRYLQQ